MISVHDIPGTHIATAYVPAHTGTDSTEKWPVFCAPFNCTITSLLIVPKDDVTGQDTNTTNLNIINVGSAGTGTTEIGNYNLISDNNLTALDAYEFTLTATNLSEHDVIVLEHEKQGTGLDVPELLVKIEYKAR